MPSKLPVPPYQKPEPKMSLPSVTSDVMPAVLPPLRTVPLIAIGRLAPVTASTMPRPKPGLFDPFSAVNCPPTATFVPSGEIATALTRPPVACGAQSSSAPLAASNEASWPRCTLPTALKLPPTYTGEPLGCTAIACTL